MPNAADMQWFKENFHTEVEAAISGTPFTLDLLVAIACQETGHIWSLLRKKALTVDQILALCVGDTIDFNPATGKGRKAFPKTKATLIAKPKGDEMFKIARKGLEEMAKAYPGFSGVKSQQVLPRLWHVPTGPTILPGGPGLLPRKALREIQRNAGKMRR